MEGIVIGIDVSKDRLDVASLPSGDAFAVERSAKGLEALAERLKALAPGLAVLEATGGFETAVTATLAAAGLPVVGVNPAQARNFAKALGQRAKTGTVDAMAVARFALAAQPEVRELPAEAMQPLAGLAGRRGQSVEMTGAERQREKRAGKRLKKSIARLLKALAKELSSLDGDIDDAVRGSPAWREKEDLLKSVPGVGPIVARALIAELPGLGRLDRKQIAAEALPAAAGPARGRRCSWEPWLPRVTIPP